MWYQLPDWAGQFAARLGDVPWLVWVSLAGGAVVLLRLGRRGRRQRRPSDAEVEVHLSTLPPPPAEFVAGPQLTCHGLPVRIRVVIAAPLGLDAGAVAGPDVLPLLNAAIPGLGEKAQVDAAQFFLWPTQFSYEGFVAAVRRKLVLPDPEEHLSPWILVMGKVSRGKRFFVLGMALLAKQANTLGPIRIDHPHQWMERLTLAVHRPNPT